MSHDPTSPRKPWRMALTLAMVAVLSACSAGSSPPQASPTSTPPPPPAQAQPADPLLPVEHWRVLFDRDADALHADTEQLSRSADSIDFYQLAYSIDGLGSMFAATGDLVYARQAFGYIDNMIESARPSSSLAASNFRDEFRGWVSESNGGEETPLYESYAWRYVTRLLRLVQPILSDMPADIREQYARILAFTEVDIVDKWLARGADDNIYRSRTHMAAHWAMIALDMSHLSGDAERRARCLEIVQNIDEHLPNYPSSLREQLQPHPGDQTAYWWSDVWGETEGPGQDVSHGSGVLAYVVESRDLDGAWSALDVARLSRTLTEFVMATPGNYPAYIDGSGRANGWIADGWVKLGRYDPAVQARLESYPVQNVQYYAAMAENAHVLAQQGD